MPELGVEVYCWRCSIKLDKINFINPNKIVVQCKSCKKNLEILEKKIEYLEQQINDYEEG